MNVPYYIFAFGSIFFGVLVPLIIIRAHRSKEKVYYVSALGSGLMLLACISAFFLQFALLAVFFAAACIISVAGYSKFRAAAQREATKQLQETNVTEPLKARELWTLKGWYKLAFRFGIHKTIGLYVLLNIGITVPVLFVLYITGLTIISAYIAPVIVEVIFIVQFYQQIKKNPLKPQRSTAHAPLAEPSA